MDAAAAALSLPVRLPVTRRTSGDPEVPLIMGIKGARDLVVTEAFNKGPFLGTEVSCAGGESGLLCDLGSALLAAATDREADLRVPKFGLSDHKKLTDFIIKAFSMHETGEQASPRWDFESSKPTPGFPAGG